MNYNPQEIEPKWQKYWEKNNFYNEIPEIEIRFPSDEMVQFGLSSKTPMYSLVGQLEKIDFLNNPANYKYDSVFK